MLRSPPVASLRDLSVAGPWPGAPVVSRADARQAQMEDGWWDDGMGWDGMGGMGSLHGFCWILDDFTGCFLDSMCFLKPSTQWAKWKWCFQGIFMVIFYDFLGFQWNLTSKYTWQCNFRDDSWWLGMVFMLLIQYIVCSYPMSWCFPLPAGQLPARRQLDVATGVLLLWLDSINRVCAGPGENHGYWLGLI